MQATALGHRLETLHDGLTTFRDKMSVPVPLVATSISIRIVSGLAFVQTTRSFRNDEGNPIEAVMTFPVGFDAVVTGLAATIDGRRMIGIAKERSEAREIYEAALDEGKLSVLHEEVLRGIHILSVGALPPGAEVLVELEQTMPLADVGGAPFLRLPMTAGQLYGTSPLLPSDDLVTADIRHVASLSVTANEGRAMLNGQELAPDETLEILLDRAVELRIEGGSFGKLVGRAADGRTVNLSLEPVGSGEAALDLHVIVDRSGSTNSFVRDRTATIWEAMRDGLVAELSAMRPTDRIALWQFDDGCQFLGAARGPISAKLVEKLDGPSGGTQLAGAIRTALAKGARDILVLTDGQTWAHMVEELKGVGPRISAILVGPQSLDANIGHLCALTGGQVMFAPGRDVASALRSAFSALRHVGAAVEGEVTEAGPTSLSALRGGVRLRAEWLPLKQETAFDCDAIGRLSAALALPLLPSETAEAFARAHSLCTHMTSLVLVDTAGEATEGFSRMRKVPLMASMPSSSAILSQLAPALSPMAPVSMSSMPADPFIPPRRILESPPTIASSALHRMKSSNQSDGHRTGTAKTKSGLAGLDRTTSTGKGLLARTLSWLLGDKPERETATFDGFAWDSFGDAILAGDLSALSNAQVLTVNELARRILSSRPAKAAERYTYEAARVLALGIIARSSSDRCAARFARRALKGAPEWLVRVT